ncbi:MAG: trehalase family glycosidase [Candidatus Saccharibacteria bacterium]|nr:trehalase family glycosidase [Candidatus Saccharibacteria bacterium]
MLDRARNAAQIVRNNMTFLRSAKNIKPEEVREARQYIRGYWKRLERKHRKDDESLLGLPNKYLVPAYEEGHEFDFNEMYYWDSYFMAQGLYDERHKDLLVGIVDNLIYMFKRFKIIPNASRTYLMGRSQPPFLTSFIWEVYEAYNLSDKWLKDAMAVAEAEYTTVWMGTVKPNVRQVHEGLSRYYDINYLHNLAEAESGWDMTPRFGHKCLEYLPVDLNALLYKYEMDFARYYRHLKDKKTAAKWEVSADKRAKVMNKLMWSDLRGLYYDYNYVKKRRGGVASLASFYPMWAGMVDKKRAVDMVGSLTRFESKGGLATTDAQPSNQFMPGSVPTQWAHPNGWAPLHYIVVKGLQRYGYDDDARRIANKWLHTNLNWYNKHGVFLEKYNVVQPHKPPLKGLYPTQTGFGWSNAVFERLCQEYVDE